jgi:FkbM family methyltransferase
MDPMGRLSVAFETVALRLARFRLTHRRVADLTDTRIGRLRLWLLLFAGLVEYYVRPVRSDRLRRVRVGQGSNARDLYLRANGVDVYTFYATFIKGLYNAALPLRRGAIVVDLGANIGITCAYWLMVCNDAQVVAVEPESNNVRLLRMNLRASEASIHEAAISERSGTELLEIRGATGHMLITDEIEAGRDLQTVRTMTPDELDTMEHFGRIDVIKADIEGAELRIFTRPWRLVSRCDRIIMEVHDDESRSKIVDFLAGMGFEHEPGERVDFPDLFSRRVADAKMVMPTAAGLGES